MRVITRKRRKIRESIQDIITLQIMWLEEVSIEKISANEVGIHIRVCDQTSESFRKVHA